MKLFYIIGAINSSHVAASSIERAIEIFKDYNIKNFSEKHPGVEEGQGCFSDESCLHIESVQEVNSGLIIETEE